MALVRGLDHVNIHTDRLDETVAFFENVLGLENRPEDRPDFGFPGAWLFLGERAVIHLVTADGSRGAHSGPFDHVAFSTDDFDGLVARLEAHGVDHELDESPTTGLRQAFFREPNGVRLEVTAPIAG